MNVSIMLKRSNLPYSSITPGINVTTKKRKNQERVVVFKSLKQAGPEKIAPPLKERIFPS